MHQLKVTPVGALEWDVATFLTYSRDQALKQEAGSTFTEMYTELDITLNALPI